VRYRHTDTDLVRSARQQDFLSQARERVPIADLVLDKHQLIDIFTEYTTSDISDAETMLQVLKLFVAARNATINEVSFPAELGPSYVYASSSAIHGAVEKFLGGEASGGPRGSLDSEPGGSGGGAKKGSGKNGKEHRPKVKAKPPGEDGLVPAREAGELEAKAITPKVSSGFPVFYPTRLPPGAAYQESDPYEHIVDPRVYHLKDQDGNRHGAYRMVATLELPDGVHYFGVQGIQGWSDPPILAEPNLTETIHGREYDIFLDGDRIKMIAWHRGDNTYWVSNSLLRVLTNQQMVGIARSAKVKIPNQKRKQRMKAKK
jgi:hypothetical protein